MLDSAGLEETYWFGGSLVPEDICKNQSIFRIERNLSTNLFHLALHQFTDEFSLPYPQLIYFTEIAELLGSLFLKDFHQS